MIFQHGCLAASIGSANHAHRQRLAGCIEESILMSSIGPMFLILTDLSSSFINICALHHHRQSSRNKLKRTFPVDSINAKVRESSREYSAQPFASALMLFGLPFINESNHRACINECHGSFIPCFFQFGDDSFAERVAFFFRPFVRFPAVNDANKFLLKVLIMGDLLNWPARHLF